MKTTTSMSGELVRLAPIDLEKDSKVMEQWFSNSEFMRLMDSEIAIPRSSKQILEWYEKSYPNQYEFIIRLKKSNEAIGFIGLGGLDWTSRDAWMGIGLGLQKNWGKGYGTEALRLLLIYGFNQLNLNRISLSIFSNNPRAIASYKKAGFKIEGKRREVVYRDGQRHDEIFMRIFREEWLQIQKNLRLIK